MQKIILFLLLLPAGLFAQSKSYYSAAGAIPFDHKFKYIGYGAEINANRQIVKDFYLGVSAGAFKFPSIFNKAYFPINLKATFFTTLNNSRLLPFAILEGGHGIYKSETFKKGGFTAFGGVGFSYASAKLVHPYASFGYGVFGYQDANGEQAALKRATLKMGIILIKRE